MTVLVYAAERGKSACVKILCEKECCRQNNDCQTA